MAVLSPKFKLWLKPFKDASLPISESNNTTSSNWEKEPIIEFLII